MFNSINMYANHIYYNFSGEQQPVSVARQYCNLLAPNKFLTSLSYDTDDSILFGIIVPFISKRTWVMTRVAGLCAIVMIEGKSVD